MDLRENCNRVSQQMLEDLAVQHAVEVRIGIRKLAVLDVELAVAKLVRFAGRVVLDVLDTVAGSTEEVSELELISAETLEQQRKEIGIRTELEDRPIVLRNELEQAVREIVLQPLLFRRQRGGEPHRAGDRHRALLLPGRTSGPAGGGRGYDRTSRPGARTFLSCRQITARRQFALQSAESTPVAIRNAPCTCSRKGGSDQLSMGCPRAV